VDGRKSYFLGQSVFWTSLMDKQNVMYWNVLEDGASQGKKVMEHIQFANIQYPWPVSTFTGAVACSSLNPYLSVKERLLHVTPHCALYVTVLFGAK
jgi:hypothetical protein